MGKVAKAAESELSRVGSGGYIVCKYGDFISCADLTTCCMTDTIADKLPVALDLAPPLRPLSP